MLTVPVTCTASDQNGNPVAGAKLTAKLNQTEIYQGIIVPEVVSVVADANGVAVLNLWPNAVGTQGSMYRITATNPDTGRKFLDAQVSVPNSACNLHQIMTVEPYPAIDASAQALAAAQGALALVTTQAGIATTKAGEASASQSSAAASAASASESAEAISDALANGPVLSVNGLAGVITDLATTAALAAPGGSASVGHLPAGTGAVARTTQSKLRESVSVKDFGAVGDGVTADTAAVQAAVAECYASRLQLHWPSGIYLTTAAIPYFHRVPHIGQGRIQRGSDVFYIEPGDAEKSIIYVSASGNDGNDGLSASQPIRTLSGVKMALVNTTANQRGGTWEIKFAAGTYVDSTNFPDLPLFRNAIRFIGAGTARTPLTIFEGSGAAYQTAGMYFLNRANVFLQYLKFQNFAAGYGVLAEKNCQLELVDCDAQACNIGFGAGYSSFIRTTRCTATSCSRGFSASSNSQASFVPHTDAIADSNRAYFCGYGFYITRMSYAHIDFNEIEDSVYAGVMVEMNSRSAVLSNNFKRNPIAFRCWTSGYISMNDASPNVFNQGTADANTETYEYRGSSGDVSLRGQSSTMDTSVYKSTTPTTVTGTVATTQIGGALFTAPAGWFVDNTKRVKFRVWGTVTTPSDATVSLQFKVSTAGLSSLSIPSSVTAQPFRLEVECIALTNATQKTLSILSYGGGANVAEIQNDTLNFSDVNREFYFFTDANGTGGVNASITIDSMELTVCG